MGKYYVNGCRSNGGDIERCDDSEAKMWALYERGTDGLSQGIIDCNFRDDAEAAMAVYAERDQLREQVRALTAKNAALERSETQLISERDIAEEALADMYHAAIGECPEWSNMFNFTDAVDEVGEQLEAAQRERDEAILLRLEVSGALSSATDRYEKAEAEIKRRDAQEPVAWQFFDNGEWHTGSDRNNHRQNTEAAGYQVRNLYAAAPAAVPEKVVKLPEMYAVSIDRTELIEKSAVMVELDAAGVKWVEGE